MTAALVPEHMLVFNVSDFLKGPEIGIFFCLKLISIYILDVKKREKGI